MIFPQLQQLVRTHPAQTKWVLVPRPMLAHTLPERLLLRDTPFANLRFVTPFELALQTAAPYLLAREINPKPEDLGPALLQDLLQNLQVPPHFRRLARQPGMAESLWRTLGELRLSEIPPQALAEPTTRQRELRALYEAYLEFLESAKLADRATVFEAAMQQRTYLPVQEADLLLEYPEMHLLPLARRFLDSLPATRLATDVPILPPTRRKIAGTVAQDTPVRRDCQLLAYLSRPPQERPQPQGDGTLSFFHAGRRDAEIHEVLRRIAEASIAVDQVEICLVDEDSLSLLQDKLAQLAVPATFEEGLPVLFSPPGQAFSGMLSWLEYSLSAFDLRRLAISGTIQCPPGTARWLERSGATWGEATYARSFGRIRKYLKDCEELDAVSRWVEEVLQKVPRPGSWRCWLQGVEELFALLVRPHEAVFRLQRFLRELRLLPDAPRPVHECLQLLRARLPELRYAQSRPMAGHVHVSTPERLGSSGRPHLFLLGMEEGKLVFRDTEDSVLSDAERVALRAELPLGSDRAAEKRNAVLHALARLDGHVCMSFSSRDARSGQEMLPALLFFQAMRLLRPELRTYEELAEALGEPVRWAALPALDSAQGWLAQSHDPDDVLRHHRWLRRGRDAEDARCGPHFTVFDGWVPSSAGRIDLPVSSASTLEGLAGCPFQFFLKKGLGLSALELPRPKPEEWLDPATKGRLLHAAFADFHRRLRALGETPQRRHDALLAEILRSHVEAICEELPPVSDAAYERDRQELRKTATRFFNYELRNPGKPLGLEVPFGLPNDEDEVLAWADPVLLEGLEIGLRGRIDRIDSDEDGLVIIDYKTGFRLCPNQEEVRFHGGRLLQPALYSWAAEQLLGKPVKRFCYYFPAQHAQKFLVLLEPPPAREEAREVLRQVLEPLRTGVFPLSHVEELDCKYCDYRPACRSAQAHAKKKLSNLDNEALNGRRVLEELR